MAQQHLDSGPAHTADSVLACYLRAQATEFLRALRQHGESGAAEETAGAARALRRAARRISGTLHTFRPLLDAEWSDGLRPELAWLSGTLAQEHAYADRLQRLNEALHRLTAVHGRTQPPAPRTEKAAPPARETLTLGAAKAAALLDRQLTLAKTRAHSTALGALGSSRFHAVADSVALLASEVPLHGGDLELKKLATAAESRLTEAVAALHHTGHPYNPDADTPWHHVRLLLRLHRYAQEVVLDGPAGDVRLKENEAAHALNAHRDAAEAAGAAAQAARTPRIAPATAYALGVLHADQRHQVEAARIAFRQAWQREAVGTP
ncbi:CHAD domain-containing protein [Streptomyces kunmingensis]|uniref:CHAD domain-containing protein n=1 Tax=Streptomyces kunmingensis TaxID=68225 RepID=A0ABU6C617_9ACTN|nr:CHAD domain-containing protein [Streptomyces kunmingensis]MEB3960028.1 CHAD domain-containing protein [Streptomyces kunmingensis]